MKISNNRLAFTIDAACESTGLARTRIYKAISDDDLKTFKVGRRRMVSAKALEQFITKLEENSKSAG